MPLPEKTLITRIRQMAGARGRRWPSLVTGIGDDCAVLNVPTGQELLVTTDFSLEGVHFRRDWHPPESAGHRCLARGLSDIASMGGEPVAAFLSLALPAELPQSWVDRFLRGFHRLAQEAEAPLAGGDTAESPTGVLADVVVVGSVPGGTALLRSGARPGDAIYVTGELGHSAAVLARLRQRGARVGRGRQWANDPHFFPQPRLAVGQWLRKHAAASAAIDLSDGLSTDLAHLCEESGVGAVVHEASLPCAESGARALEFALHGGEDYELLFTAPAAKAMPSRIAGVKITLIGEVVKGERMWLLGRNGGRKPLRARGWEHFAERSAL